MVTTIGNQSTPSKPYCNFKECPKVGQFKCSACSIIIYCSKECQKKDWPEHKDICRRLSVLTGVQAHGATRITKAATDSFNY